MFLIFCMHREKIRQSLGYNFDWICIYVGFEVFWSINDVKKLVDLFLTFFDLSGLDFVLVCIHNVPKLSIIQDDFVRYVCTYLFGKSLQQQKSHHYGEIAIEGYCVLQANLYFHRQRRTNYAIWLNNDTRRRNYAKCVVVWIRNCQKLVHHKNNELLPHHSRTYVGIRIIYVAINK